MGSVGLAGCVGRAGGRPFVQVGCVGRRVGHLSSMARSRLSFCPQPLSSVALAFAPLLGPGPLLTAYWLGSSRTYLHQSCESLRECVHGWHVHVCMSVFASSCTVGMLALARVCVFACLCMLAVPVVSSFRLVGSFGLFRLLVVGLVCSLVFGKAGAALKCPAAGWRRKTSKSVGVSLLLIRPFCRPAFGLLVVLCWFVGLFLCFGASILPACMYGICRFDVLIKWSFDMEQ